jgi:PilZ domain
MRTVDDLGFFSGKPMNNRSAGRNRVLKSATIEFGGGALTCVVRNWSDTGAMLDVSPIGIPEHFILLGPGDGRRRPCRLVWRKEKRIGVAFE